MDGEAMSEDESTALATVPRTSATGEIVERAIDKAMPDAPDELKKGIGKAIAPWAEKLVRGLDDLIRVPGTNIGIGLDPIIGFFLPGAGDFATGAGSVALLFLALKHRIPTMVIGKMILNIAIDTAVGTVPIVGDLFDLLFKSNRRNLDLIEQYRDNPKLKPTTGDYLLVIGGIILAILSVILPMLMFWFVLGGITCAGIFGASAASSQ
jgi:hypothetical protein